METHSSILAWRIPWTEEPGRLRSMRSPRVGLKDLARTQKSILCSSQTWPGGGSRDQ